MLLKVTQCPKAIYGEIKTYINRQVVISGIK